MLTKGMKERHDTPKKSIQSGRKKVHMFLQNSLKHSGQLIRTFCENECNSKRNELILPNEKKSPAKAWALMSAIVSQLVGSILVGIFFGKWMDQKLGTLPLFLIVGLLLGLASGIYGMLKLIRHFSED